MGSERFISWLLFIIWFQLKEQTK